MQRPRRQSNNWIIFALVFVISLILYLIPYLRELLMIVAIAAILYMFVKNIY